MRVNPYLIDRKIKGRFFKDFEDLKKHKQCFCENFHIDENTYENIFKLLKPYLVPKRNTRPVDKILPEEKFAAVIEYFASGSFQRHMASIYRISKQHFGTIIDEVCDAICQAFKSTVPAVNKENFIKCANDFNKYWQFPNCIGAIDGKHVALKSPPKAGSLFYNYKGFHSIVLMAVADATYKFTYIDVGAYGSEGDTTVVSSSQFGKSVINDELNFPEDATVQNTKLPFFFIADDAFPICKRIMKPYRGKTRLTDEEIIFNYRLSRARRCVENAFGILCAKWLCLKRTMFCSPDRAQKIIMACCFLHNYLMKNNKINYCPPTFADSIDENGRLVEGEWRKQTSTNEDSLFGSCISTFKGRQSDIGKYIREKLKNYVNSPEGSVSWQQAATYLYK